MAISSWGILGILREARKDQRKIRCKKCGAIHTVADWWSVKAWTPECPKCGTSMFSTIWTGEKPNFEFIKRKKEAK